MKNRYTEYINQYFYITVVSIVIGIFTLITGYGYSPAVGVIRGKHAFAIFFFGLALIFIILNFIYVHLKRKYKKQGKYDE